MVHRIWPSPATLNEEALRDAYALDRSNPSVRANFVTSLDGAVEVGGVSRPLSSDADRDLFALMRAHTDAVMVGAGTLRRENYGPVRTPDEHRKWRITQLGLAAHPTLVVVSATLDLDPTSAPFADAPARPIVLTHAAAPADRRSALSEVADVITCGESVIDLAVALAELRSRGLDQVLCEGGPQLFGALVAADLVDELCLTISPLLAGAGADRIVTGAGRPSPLPMHLVHLLACDDMLFARYVRERDTTVPRSPDAAPEQ